MKYKGPLTEATLLKRYFRFLVDVALINKRKRTIHCPNLGPLINCDVLGSRVWFSSTGRIHGYLDVLEIVEVNGGWLVGLNPDHTKLLVMEGVHLGLVPELRDFRFLHTPISPSFGNGIELLLKENGEQCFLHVEQVVFGDEKGEGYFPDSHGVGILPLKELIALKESGHRAILFYCVQHTGVRCLKPADLIDPQYGQCLRDAARCGVEILAYRTNITLREMNLECRIPVLLSEDITSK